MCVHAHARAHVYRMQYSTLHFHSALLDCGSSYPLGGSFFLCSCLFFFNRLWLNVLLRIILKSGVVGCAKLGVEEISRTLELNSIQLWQLKVGDKDKYLSSIYPGWTIPIVITSFIPIYGWELHINKALSPQPNNFLC